MRNKNSMMPPQYGIKCDTPFDWRPYFWGTIIWFFLMVTFILAGLGLVNNLTKYNKCKLDTVQLEQSI